MSGVDAERLGHSYGFRATSRKAFKFEDLTSSVLSTTSSTEEPDAILVHCGINDIKKASPHEMSESFVKKIKDLSTKSPQTKIVSKIAPMKNAELEVKRKLFNAFNSSKLFDSKNISLVDHENLFTSKSVLSDGVHPTSRGASVLAGNVGRHLRDLFWTRPRSIRRRSSNYLPPRGLSNNPRYPVFPSNNSAWQNSYEMLAEWY